MRVNIEFEDAWGYWKHLQVMNHVPSARNTAKTRAKSTKKRHRLTNEHGHLLDLLTP